MKSLERGSISGPTNKGGHYEYVTSQFLTFVEDPVFVGRRFWLGVVLPEENKTFVSKSLVYFPGKYLPSVNIYIVHI